MLFNSNDSDAGFVDQSLNKEENDPHFEVEVLNEQQGPLTETPKLNTRIQVDRYKTLMSGDADTKNIPKTFGNNFKKFMDDYLKNNKEVFKDEILKELNNFLNKKKASKSADYTIQDFREIFHCKEINYWFQFYVENGLYLDLINSNRVADPEKYITFIEQYLAGAKDPLNFISNRPIKDRKEDLKKKKLNNKQEEVQQIEVQQLPKQQVKDVVNQNQHSTQIIDQDHLNQFFIQNSQAQDFDNQFNNNNE